MRRISRLHRGEEWLTWVRPSSHPHQGPRRVSEAFLNPPEKASHELNTSVTPINARWSRIITKHSLAQIPDSGVVSCFKPLQLVSFVTAQTGTHILSHVICTQPSEVGSMLPFYRKGNHSILNQVISLRFHTTQCRSHIAAQFLDSARACLTGCCLQVLKRKNLQSCHGSPAFPLVFKVTRYSEGCSSL